MVDVMPRPPAERETYLGDGLYATHDGYQIELYSHNGIHKTASVYLEPSVLDAFEQYVKKLKETQHGRDV